MTHDFSHDPVKIRVVDIKTGAWKQTYVFTGYVPSNIEKELIRLEKNPAQKTNPILKSFYGPSWQTKLGVLELYNASIDRAKPQHLKGVSGGSIEGEAQKLRNNTSDLSYLVGGNEFELDDDLLSELNEIDTETLNDNVNNNDYKNINVDKDTEDKDTEDTEDKDTEDKDTEDKGKSKNKINSPSNDNADLLEITDLDIAQANDNLLGDREETMDIKHTGGIKFITETNAYPVDNVLDLKYKIFLTIGIPIYRQHLWFKYKQKSYPASYVLSIHKTIENIDIERLVAFYVNKEKTNDSKTNDSKTNDSKTNDSKTNDSKTNDIGISSLQDDIEGVPVELEYYKNKDFLHVSAQDTFELLRNIYYKYATNEFFLVDLNDLIKPADIYNRISKDKYQIEVIYYGFVILYFPMITLGVFLDYIKNERNLRQLYPELYPDKTDLSKKVELENSITDRAYENIDNKNIDKLLFSSVTQTIVSIDNYNQDVAVVLDLRNLFDVIELNETVTYCKVNMLRENQNIILKKTYLNEKEPKDILPIGSLLIKIKTNHDTNENMRIILFKNGNYVIKTEWREENHMDFKKITKAVQDKINPIIRTINKLGDRVKYQHIQLVEVQLNNVIFTETALTFYYDNDVTDARFVVFKNILDDFRRAKIITAKENISMGYEYFFNKGMYKYDASRIEKAIAIDNYYDYLSNGIVKQRWETVFERTRLFQIINVSSKLKINISGIRNDIEMEYYHMYLKGLLSIYDDQAKKIKVVGDETMQSKSKRALKNLKVQDPLLYDFKKIYKSNVIYSKICQKPYQPIILTDEEMENLPKDRKAKALRYWNFTKQKPVWYSCPNVKFPYIKFIVKQHPKDYCIPCCKKIAMNENVNIKKQEIHNGCMKEHSYTGEKINLTKGSHYIASYGKNIEVGRISRLPENTLEPLFFDTYSPDGGIDQECATADGYYLFGVDQHTLALNDVGMMYCLSHALNMSVDAFLSECNKRIKKSPDKFRVLLDGNAGLYFAGADDLSAHILTLNTDDTIIPNIMENLPWNLLFISIGYYYFGINVVLFDDQQKEMIELLLPKGLKKPDEMFPESHKNLVIFRKKTKYYPIYLFNTEIFKRTGIIDTRLFLNESGLITIIRAVVRKNFMSFDYEKIKQTIDLSTVREFAKDTGAEILHYYINYSNLCYAVIIKFRGTDIYFPVNSSHYPLINNISLIFDPYVGSYDTSFDNISNLINSFNKWNVNKSKEEKIEGLLLYPKIEVHNWFKIKGEPKISGFLFDNTNYFFKPISEKEALQWYNKPIQILLYHPYKINALIFSVKNGSKKIEENADISSQLQYSMYDYYLYNLVQLHFIDLFNAQRNVVLRKNLTAVLFKTDFNKNLDGIRDFLKSIEDPEDSNKLKNIISRYITAHHDKKQMLSDISNTYFNFDKVALEKMKLMPVKKVADELHKLAKSFVKIGNAKSKNFKFPNIFMSCDNANIDGKDSGKEQYCEKNKLIITADKLKDIVSILAGDIVNPSKWKWLFNSVFVEKVVDFFKFIRRKNETITVEFL